TGLVTVLVATNVAARGIHVDDLDLVVNVDPPPEPAPPVRRAGREARAFCGFCTAGCGTSMVIAIPEGSRAPVSRASSSSVDFT
ncbi:helicase-related protein, partial [Streptomyces niveus]|uniref:helicase-related protein n=1 Tax=Streptomyces niveus TaxID=193462 RepID=UPI0026EB776A